MPASLEGDFRFCLEFPESNRGIFEVDADVPGLVLSKLVLLPSARTKIGI